MGHASRTTRVRRRGVGKPASARPRPRSVARREQLQVPEWETESWKHRVEAEARRSLKQRLGGVGAHRQ
jgi:hypothetical protein